MTVILSPLQIFEKITHRALPNYTRAFEHDEALFDKYEINTPLRLCHFFAQVLYECGSGTILFENMRYKTAGRLLQIFGVGRHSAAIRPDEVDRYLDNPEGLAERVYGLGNPIKAQKLGNKRPGDGYRYRGGGLLQTTGGDAYARMGQRAGADFYDHPELIVDPRYALKPAIYEWDDGKCNKYADKNDLRTITIIINGGLNGLEGRQALFDRNWPIISKDSAAAWSVSLMDEDTMWLQEALNELGADPLLLVDGRYGPATTEAVRKFQILASLPVDGVAGPVTRAAITLRLDSKRG
ncbi:peptidoglycan-binding protein [Methylobacterium sp. Gmos1]